MRFSMFLSGLGTSRTSPGKRPATQAIRRAARWALFEDLEKRQLLSSYTVPSGTTQVYLEKDPTYPSEYVDVHLGSPSAPVASGGYLDGSTSTNTDTITTYDSGVTLYDEVPAVYKPSGGISFQSGADGALVIQAGDSDTSMEVTSTASTGSTIQVYDQTDSVYVNDVIGGDVTSLNE